MLLSERKRPPVPALPRKVAVTVARRGATGVRRAERVCACPSPVRGAKLPPLGYRCRSCGGVCS
jgi:hypothetical protein